MFALKMLFFRERNYFNQKYFQLCLNQISVYPEESESTFYLIYGHVNTATVYVT